jgi:hypothetical protein
MFGQPSMSTKFSSFKQVLALKLSGGNPIPDLKRFATLFSHLNDRGLDLNDHMEALILAALPAKWDGIAQQLLQRNQQHLMFPSIHSRI